jgi:hypothetical protein
VLSYVESARGQLPGCSGSELSEFALLVNVLQLKHGFKPSKALLDDLAAALLSLLPREPWRRKRGAVATVLDCMSESGWQLSVALHDRAASELLRAAAGTATAEHSSSTGPAVLTASQAKSIVHAWLAFAAQPGSPARATLPAVLRAVGALPAAPMLGSAQRLGGAGAASELLPAILRQLSSAHSVEAVARVHDAAGAYFGREHVCAAIRRLAELCPPR